MTESPGARDRSDDPSAPASPAPETDTEGAVDAMEDRVAGRDDEAPPGRDEDRAAGHEEPAFDLDLDPEDQGTAEAGSEQTG